MKEIYLANNKGIILVDDENYEWLNQYKWTLNAKYANTKIKINNKRKSKYIHRLIMNEPENMQIDHIDGNGLNNQKNNLRIVTQSQNQMNKISAKNSSSQYKGVCFVKSRNKWLSSICINKRNYNLGNFKNEEDAARAYNEAAQKYFGEYAHLNEVIK